MGQGSFPKYITVLNSTAVVFSAEDNIHGRELWISDGTAANTVMIKDINPGVSGSSPRHFTKLSDGFVYFSANDGLRGVELWKTDGTVAGTVLVRDICKGECSSTPKYLTTMSNSPKLFFAANFGPVGAELWLTDGSAGGTERAFDNTGKDIDFDLHMDEDSRAKKMIEYHGSLYYAARESFKKASDLESIYSEIGDYRGVLQAFVIEDEDADVNTDLFSVTLKSENQMGHLFFRGTRTGLLSLQGEGSCMVKFSGTLASINNALRDLH